MKVAKIVPDYVEHLQTAIDDLAAAIKARDTKQNALDALGRATEEINAQIKEALVKEQAEVDRAAERGTVANTSTSQHITSLRTKLDLLVRAETKSKSDLEACFTDCARAATHVDHAKRPIIQEHSKHIADELLKTEERAGQLRAESDQVVSYPHAAK
jgi:hypothetical protein